MRARCLIREQPAYRRDAFAAGLEAAGYRICARIADPGPDDIAVIWNRYGVGEATARQIEAAGGRTLVCENGYLGRDWRGGHWYAISLTHHNGAGTWYPGGPERWDGWNVDLAPFRDGTGDILVLPQRGIGPRGVAMPADFRQRAMAAIGGNAWRWRPHPGELTPPVTLDEDLSKAGLVVTWGSGAALKALAAGVPVAHLFERWIGAPAARLGRDGVERPRRCERARLEMFRRLAWAMWRVEEIANGEPFRHLLLREGRPG